MSLIWYCTNCEAKEPVEPTGDGFEYDVGDKEPCIDCGSGTAHVLHERDLPAFLEERKTLAAEDEEADE